MTHLFSYVLLTFLLSLAAATALPAQTHERTATRKKDSTITHTVSMDRALLTATLRAGMEEEFDETMPSTVNDYFRLLDIGHEVDLFIQPADPEDPLRLPSDYPSELDRAVQALTDITLHALTK